MQPNDRASSKFFTSLMNLLSAFPAVYEVLAEKELENKESYTFREVPDTIIGLLDRLVMVNTRSKVHSLFNEEQSQVFGLRLLSVMTCCLDTLLLLECQYKIWDMLLQGQEHNKTTDGDGFIVDMLSIERNHILVRSYVIGGPSERRLPCRDLEKASDDPYPWPLFASFPVPKEYTTTISRPSAIKQDTDLSKLLSKSQSSTPSAANSKEWLQKCQTAYYKVMSIRHESVTNRGMYKHPPPSVANSKEWLQKCQTAYCKVMSIRHESVTNRVITDLLDKVITHTLMVPQNEIFPLKPCKVTDSALKGQKLTDLQMLGIKMVIRYGQHLKLISNSSDATENLTLLLKKCRYYFRTQQRSMDSEIRCLQGDYTGHDWFVSTVFLLMAGNRDKAWSFLHNFSSVLASGYLWMPRLHASTHLPVELAVSGIHPVFSTTGYNVELILQTEVPHVYSAFRMSGYTPSQICQHWLRQCFWNYLDWQEICHYMTICIVMGIDYQVYLCVAILRYLEPDILLNTQQQKLQVFLKENGIKRFCVGHHMEYMKELETKFRNTVLPDMQNLNKA
ncbi:protein broad-minded-like [Amphiura filiformis]|uniref:protein broad-minded-like n=1 Tax=Amphiura filiformis TaxID=82378 RepID=UPI003B220EDD